MRAVNAVLTGAIALAVTIGLSTDLGAQSLRAAKGPAERPPSSYKGSSYVDSRGCVYIRAGYDGNVSWIPRVTRARRQVCGLKPTAGIRSTAQTTVKTARPTTPTTTVALGVAPPKAKRKKANWNWFTAPRRTQVKTATVQAPVLVPTPKLRPRTRVVAVAPSAPRIARGGPIRTTPQAVHPADYYNGRLGRGGIAGQGAQVTRVQPFVLPKGYKSLLTTDVAQARRGFGTAQGQAQMDLLWTQTTPRRLIDVTTGRDMTMQLPQVKYPYTTITASTRAFAPATAAPIRKKHKKKRPVDDAASPLNMIEVEDVSALDPNVKSNIPKTELKVTTKTKTAAAFRFVQVATFGVPANASRTMTRFQSGGMPTVSRALTRKGKTYAIVMLGPFRDDTALKAALTSARRAGFSDAFFVK
ncbi:MAG: SPOR domain-containing protein [Alphaproteobacteria bacterium]|nr:SPOR domain-containing protein [Alphaproteobacteria bacterium]